MWRLVGAVKAASLKAACKQMRDGLEDDGLRWKWHQGGNGKTHAYLRCSAHVDCGVLRRLTVQDLPAEDGQLTFGVEEQGKHTTVLETKARANAALTLAQEKVVQVAVDAGSSPAAVLVALTKDKVAELKRRGLNPLQHKKKKGGMKGARIRIHHYSLLFSKNSQ